MLKKQVSNQTVYYHDSQNDKQALVLLHGWGQSGELMMPIYDYFKDQYRVFYVDFPGFGLSDELKQKWGV